MTGRILVGTASWTDRSLLDAGWYPKGANTVDEVWKRFSGALAPLQRAGKLGAVLFQFPPWFGIKGQHKDYLVECAERARPIEFLSGHGLASVCVDSGRRKGAVPALPVATSPQLAVVRFHGRARGQPGHARSEQQYLYPTKVLQSWVPKLRALAKEADVVQAVFRNVHQDYSVRSAERLQRLLEPAGAGS